MSSTTKGGTSWPVNGVGTSSSARTTNFKEAAARCAAAGEWREWADLFTEDARYLEHTFGEFHGREEIYDWISSTMAEWPNCGHDVVPPRLVRL